MFTKFSFFTLFFTGMVWTAGAQTAGELAGCSNDGVLEHALTPPMGWNSYDAFGDSVTEGEVLANARYLKEHLLAHGWQYVVIDFR